MYIAVDKMCGCVLHVLSECVKGSAECLGYFNYWFPSRCVHLPALLFWAGCAMHFFTGAIVGCGGISVDPVSFVDILVLSETSRCQRFF